MNTATSDRCHWCKGTTRVGVVEVYEGCKEWRVVKIEKCRCRFGSLGPKSFNVCQRCGKKHDGGDGAAGAREAKHRISLAAAGRRGKRG